MVRTDTSLSLRGNMRLNVGKYGTLEDTTETLATINTENNVSNRSYDQQIPRFKPLYHDDRGFRGRGRRR
jgi:hypothetical protein